MLPRALFFAGLVALSLAALGGSIARVHGKPAVTSVTPQPITVHAIPLQFDADNHERKTFGKLIWRGGLTLSSPSKLFGGFSGLIMSPDGRRMFAVSDAGLWFEATLSYSGRRPVKVSEARIAALSDAEGKPFEGPLFNDAEAITPVDGEQLASGILVAFERKSRILRYGMSASGPGKPLERLKLPKALRAVKSNKGLEGLAILPTGPLKGTLVAFPERLKDKNGDLIGFLIGGPRPGSFVLKRLGGFDVTDLAALPDGDLLVLERRFRFSEGPQMRIRRLPAENIRRGARLRGEVLLQADTRWQIDNMEGIAVHRSGGRTVITLISDDNFNFLQRTILLQFELPSESLTAK